MLTRVRKFAARLHKDESGPNTVEWVLLIVVAMVVLLGIWLFVKWALGEMNDQKEGFETGVDDGTSAGGDGT